MNHRGDNHSSIKRFKTCNVHHYYDRKGSIQRAVLATLVLMQLGRRESCCGYAIAVSAAAASAAELLVAAVAVADAVAEAVAAVFAARARASSISCFLMAAYRVAQPSKHSDMASATPDTAIWPE